MKSLLPLLISISSSLYSSSRIHIALYKQPQILLPIQMDISSKDHPSAWAAVTVTMNHFWAAGVYAQGYGLSTN